MTIRYQVPVLLITLVLSTSGLQAQQSAESIFNGRDLSGWEGNPELWSVEDGVLTGRTSDEKPIAFNTFLIWKGGNVANFELELDYKITAAGNSGIQYRSRVLDEEDHVVGGYQADIDGSLKYAGINYEEKGRGILAQRGQRVTIQSAEQRKTENFGDGAELGKHIKADSWNHYRIVARDNTLSHYINGQLMSQVIDLQKDKAAQEGVLALQVHRGPAMTVQFKNMQLKKLD